MSLLYAERDWDYIVKKTQRRWVAKNAYGKTLAQSATNTSLEDLFNACINDNVDAPKYIRGSGGGQAFNIDGTIIVSKNTRLDLGGQNQVGKLSLEASADCDMIAPEDVNDTPNVILSNMQLDGNADNQSAGNWDGISWEITDATSASGGTLWMLDIYNIKADDCKRNNIRVTTSTGSYATLVMDTIKAYSADAEEIYLGRCFDGAWSRIQCGEMVMEDNCDSNNIYDLYLAGAHSPNLYIDGCEENGFTLVRSDNSSGKSIVIEDSQWQQFSNTQITNLNEFAADDTWTAIEIDNSDNTRFFGLGFVKNPAESSPNYKYGIQEINASTLTLLVGADFDDACATAEIDALAASGSLWREAYYDNAGTLTAARVV